MNEHFPSSLAFAVSLLCVPLVAQRAEVGEAVPDTRFPLFQNGDGRQQLSDFFGQPVVIDLWGTRCGPCIGTAVPNAIRHDQEHRAEGLVTILVESQGADAEQLERFLWQRFPDNECFSCVGTPVPIPKSRGIPHCGVVGVDGKLVWAGNPAAFPKHVEDAVAAELKKVKKGWGDSADARKVRAALYGKGDFLRAVGVVEAIEDETEKAALAAEIEKRYGVMKAAVENLRKHGRWLAARAAATALQKGVGKHEAWAAEVAELVASFETEAAKQELALDAKLDKVLRTMRKGKLERAPKHLQKIIDKGAAGKVAARAQRILGAVQQAGE